MRKNDSQISFIELITTSLSIFVYCYEFSKTTRLHSSSLIIEFVNSINFTNNTKIRIRISMRNKRSIRVVEAPVVVVVSWLFVSCEIVSFGSGQVQVWNESLSDFFSVLQQNMNTVVVSHKICNSSRVCVHLFVRFVYPVV